MFTILTIAPKLIVEICIISIIVSCCLFMFIVIMWQQNKTIITTKKKGYLINTMLILIGIIFIASIVILITKIENPSLNYQELIKQANSKLPNYK